MDIRIRKPHTEETKRKIGLANKGKPSWIKGRNMSEEAKIKISIANKINTKRLWQNPEYRRHMSEAHKGKQNNIGKHWKLSEDKKLKMRGRKKDKLSYKTSQDRIARRVIEYRLWREAVFARDNWTCYKCNSKGIYLHPHHINNFAQYIDLRYAIDNGITLCIKCHKLFHKVFGKKNNNINQIEEFIGGKYTF